MVDQGGSQIKIMSTILKTHQPNPEINKRYSPPETTGNPTIATNGIAKHSRGYGDTNSQMHKSKTSLYSAILTCFLNVCKAKARWGSLARWIPIHMK